jgi:uncharacterized membrane protein
VALPQQRRERHVLLQRQSHLAGRIATISRLQAMLLVIMVFLAVAMARGFGSR